MKFCFVAQIESPSERSVFHFRVRELGIKPEFDKEKVVARYEGSPNSKMAKKLTELYETQPIHLITVST